MKKVLIAVAAIAALPATAQAQDVQAPGVYFGVEGGLNWMFNTTILGQNVSPRTGWALGGKIGYDFIGPRVEVEGLYRENGNGNFFGNRAITGRISQTSIMANFLYDFNATGAFVPYIGAGAGVGLVNSDFQMNSTVFAYQGILGVGYNFSPNLRFNLEGRYFGTTNPTVAGTYWNNNNITALAGVQIKFGCRSAAAAAAAADGCAAVVHGVLRLGPLEPEPAGAGHDQAGGRRLQDQGQRPHHGDRPHRHVGPGSLQHGAVAASCQRGEGRPGA